MLKQVTSMAPNWTSLKEPLRATNGSMIIEDPAVTSKQPTKDPPSLYSSWSMKKTSLLLTIAMLLLVLVFTSTVAAVSRIRHAVFGKPTRYVAFIGNSITYYYDLPRSLQVVSDYSVQQNSILAGSGSLANMEWRENGMWNRWRTDSNLLYTLDDQDVDENDNNSNNNAGFVDDQVWDFGACTVSMLIEGHDVEEAQAFYDDWWDYRDEYGLEDDDGWAYGVSTNDDPRMTNPCAQSQAYLDYLASLPKSDIRINPRRWDYLVLTDRTKGPKFQELRDEAIGALGETYLPLLHQSEATPIFLVTHAYWLDRDEENEENLNTFENVPYWTVETYEGYRQYADYLGAQLPRAQRPKFANLGIAYLVVYEENPDLWSNRLFWTDNKHPSPYGSFLQSCLLHHVVYGHAPDRSLVIRENMTSLWDDTRTLMYPRDTQVPFPTTEEAEYLYGVCKRVADGYLPPTFQEVTEKLGLSLYN